jgi:lipoprotein signal peptidase
MRVRRVLLVSIALLFAAVDLLHKTFDAAEIHHARTPIAALITSALVVALAFLVPRVPSNVAAVGAGVVCGAALGNLVSLLVWGDGVPDPLVVAGVDRGVAFNLADVFALAGDALLLSAVVAHGVRHRERLREPV